MRELNTVNFVS